MTYTYSFSPTTDLTRIRFHTGDTDSSAPIWPDEEIAFVQAEVGTYQMTVIYLLQSLVAKLGAERKFTADWLSIDTAGAMTTYTEMLKQKRRLFGIPEIVGTSQHPYRPDSGSSGPPDYTETQNNAYGQYDPNNGSLGGFTW